jgi:hypothetical protein
VLPDILGSRKVHPTYQGILARSDRDSVEENPKRIYKVTGTDGNCRTGMVACQNAATYETWRGYSKLSKENKLTDRRAGILVNIGIFSS